MKATVILSTIIILLFPSVTLEAQTVGKGKKILIAYFSRSGNTQRVANQIKESAGGDIFRIETVTPYPEAYQATIDQVKKEIASDYKPAIKGKVENILDYDVIFVGSPIWWSTIAPPVSTFLSGHDLSGKTIITFVTHEGSGIGNSVADIKKLCPESVVWEGLAIRGTSAGKAQEEIRKWVNEITK